MGGDVGLNLVSVLDAAHGIDAVLVLGKARHNGARAGCDHELIVADRCHLSVWLVHRNNRNLLGRTVKAHRLGAI